MAEEVSSEVTLFTVLQAAIESMSDAAIVRARTHIILLCFMVLFPLVLSYAYTIQAVPETDFKQIW